MTTRRGAIAGTFALALGSWAPFEVRAQKANAVEVSRVWARPTPRSAPNGVIYMDIRNSGSVDVTVNAIVSDVATKAEIHRTVRTDGVARMEKVGPLRVAAGETVSLKPDGLHVMLTELKSQLITGRTFPAKLVFDDESSVTVNVEVFPRTPPQPGHH